MLSSCRTGDSSALDDLHIASGGWVAMNRAVVGPETSIRICLSVENDFLDSTHWALDLGQRRIDLNIGIPNGGIHLLVGQRKRFRL